MLPTPSPEQEEILLAFKAGYNIVAQSCPGSGKTTSLLHLARIAKESFNTSALILTYNRSLKDEVSERINSLGLQSHCDIYTYHGYASKIYHANIYTDVLLKTHLNRSCDTTPHQIILVDEVQDMTADYYRLLLKILSQGKILVLVGDKNQCINEHRGASSEYLTNYTKYFDTGRPWKELKLRTSYRLTPRNAKFVNEHILKEDLIIPGNLRDENVFPIYSYGVWDAARLVTTNVRKYGPDNVVIMVASANNISPKSPLGKIIAKREDGILFHVNNKDSTEVSDEASRGKVLITSFNSMKGRERKCTIVMNFDESYFEFYDREWPKDAISLPNIIYVAATRAKEQLIVINDDKKRPFRTVNPTTLSETCIIRGGQAEKIPIVVSSGNRHNNVTDIIRHRNTSDVYELLQLLTIERIQPPTDALLYKSLIQFDGYQEDITRYYGMLIPLLAQLKLTGKAGLTITIETRTKPRIIDLIRRHTMLDVKPDKSIPEWMEHIIINTAINTNCYFLADQVKHYNWVDANYVQVQVDRIVAKLTPDGVFEKSYSIKTPYQLDGIFDYYSEKEIWEFKCATALSNEYELQCGAYIALHFKNENAMIPAILYNTRTDEMVRITLTNPDKYLDILMRRVTPTTGLELNLQVMRIA